MKLILQRTHTEGDATLGVLLVDGLFECYTLEDLPRPTKVAGQTRIPAGLYVIIITESPRFGRPMPLLLGVPGFTGVRVHPGNVAADTAGCVLVGEALGEDGRSVVRSRVAFERLLAQMFEARSRGEGLLIEVLDEDRAQFPLRVEGGPPAKGGLE